MSHTTSSFNSMKFRLWRRRMSVSSPRMTIKSQLPWPMRLLFAVVIGLAGAGAMWGYDMGLTFPAAHPENLRDQLSRYKDQVEKLNAQLDQYSATVNSAESQLNIERSAQKQLASQVRSLEAENSHLKEDLAFFESLLPNGTGALGVSIRRLKIDPVTPSQIHYRLLIMQGGKGDHEFVGNLQLIVTTLQGGKSAMMTFPNGNPAEQDKYKLSFKHYQRIEGVLTLPEGAVAKLVQARVLEKGQIRAQQSVNL